TSFPPAHSAPSSKARANFEEIETETKEGFVLKGTLYLAFTPNKPLVVMLHSFAMKSSDWGDLPKKVRDLGYNVLTLDLKGHGKSVYNTSLKYQSYLYFKPQDWRKIPLEALEVIDDIRQNYPRIDCTKISFIGADLGANAAVLTGVRLKNPPEKLVLISPYVNFKSLYIPVVISSYTKSSMMVIVSDADTNSRAQADMLSRFIQTPLTKKVYPTGGSGMLLLKRNAGSEDEILNFLR
ncbi:putative hydrolase alpha/beta fold family, partial [Candidatus Gastranaerophilus sp. (ex Termes propinquus)]